MSIYDEAQRGAFIAKGLEVYERLKEELEARHHGEIVAIRPETGEYFVGKKLLKAEEQARSADRDAWYLFVRIGEPDAHIPLQAW